MIIKNLRELCIQWMNEAIAMKPGEELYIPCENKEDRTRLYKIFIEELKILQQIDPESSSKITIIKSIKDKKFWVFLRRKAGNPYLAFKKDIHGSVSKVSLLEKEKGKDEA